jgi:hypothetical protein
MLGTLGTHASGMLSSGANQMQHAGSVRTKKKARLFQAAPGKVKAYSVVVTARIVGDIQANQERLLPFRPFGNRH